VRQRLELFKSFRQAAGGLQFYLDDEETQGEAELFRNIQQHSVGIGQDVLSDGASLQIFL
jgi:hypothetical protein